MIKLYYFLLKMRACEILKENHTIYAIKFYDRNRYKYFFCPKEISIGRNINSKKSDMIIQKT